MMVLVSLTCQLPIEYFIWYFLQYISHMFFTTYLHNLFKCAPQIWRDVSQYVIWGSLSTGTMMGIYGQNMFRTCDSRDWDLKTVADILQIMFSEHFAVWKLFQFNSHSIDICL